MNKQMCCLWSKNLTIKVKM